MLSLRPLLVASLPDPTGFESATGFGDQSYFELLVKLVGPARAAELAPRVVARAAGFESAAIEPVGAELIDLVYRSPTRSGGFESSTGDLLPERVRLSGSARMRAALEV